MSHWPHVMITERSEKLTGFLRLQKYVAITQIPMIRIVTVAYTVLNYVITAQCESLDYYDPSESSI